MELLKTYQFKLKPTVAQERMFGQWLGSCRYVYNLCLHYKRTVYEQYRVSLTAQKGTGFYRKRSGLDRLRPQPDFAGCGGATL